MFRSSLSGAFRSSLGRQPFATSTTTNMPLHRLASQASQASRRSAAGSMSGSSRSIHWSTARARTAGLGRSPTVLRNPHVLRNGTTARDTTQRLLSRTQKRNFSWSWSRKSPPGGAKGQEESLSLSARLRKLSREYGWAAVGVYMGLSVLDFPFCFLLVRIAGTDRIAEIEHWFLSNVKKAIPESIKSRWYEYRAALKSAEKNELGNNNVSEDMEKVGWGVEEAQERHKEEASLATQLALAYAIHKTFIFVRVPLTAAVTPNVVKVLRSWGWQIGKRKPKTKQ